LDRFIECWDGLDDPRTGNAALHDLACRFVFGAGPARDRAPRDAGFSLINAHSRGFFAERATN